MHWKLSALALLVPALAAADDTAYDYRTALNRCTPSCYEREKFEGPAKKVKVCAYLPIHFIQERRGKSWSKLERSSAMSPIYVAGCKFPKGVPGKWKAIVAQARRQIDLAPGDVVTVAADFDDWGIEKDDFGRITARDVVIDHYSRGHEAFDGCRQGNPFAVCEGENNEVTSFNQASYRIAEAKKLKDAGSAKECRISAWDAWRQAVATRKERERFVADGSWKSRTYATRYDGLLGEKELFAKNDALETESQAVWKSCGGKGDLPND